MGPGVDAKIVPLVKSATDFLDMSQIDITFNVAAPDFEALRNSFLNEDRVPDRAWLMYSPADQTQFEVKRIRLEDGNWEPDPEMAQVEASYVNKFAVELGATVGFMGCCLESRDSIIRREETNFGNFIADLIRTEYATDFALVNAGSFRKNGVIPAGPISLMHLQESFPFNDIIVVLRMTGKVFLEALEHAVSAYPAEEGRFPQVSNV